MGVVQQLIPDTAAALPQVERAVAQDGFAFVDTAAMQAALLQCGALPDWASFAASWDDLAVDTWMADGGRYRRRRHAIYSVNALGDIVREPHSPHWQSRDYNPLNGGIARWFEPVTDAMGASASLNTVLRCCQQLFHTLSPDTARWHVEVHQFRIEARLDTPGQPTPEGLHRDGVDYVLVLLIQRHNIASGTTSIHDLAGRELGSFTLTQPFDAAIVNDARVYHGVTAVQPLDPAQEAHRDVLVVTFRSQNL